MTRHAWLLAVGLALGRLVLPGSSSVRLISGAGGGSAGAFTSMAIGTVTATMLVAAIATPPENAPVFGSRKAARPQIHPPRVSARKRNGAAGLGQSRCANA